jgi:cholesterol oxidase
MAGTRHPDHEARPAAAAVGQSLSRRNLFRLAVAGAGTAVASGALGRFQALAAYGAVPGLAGKSAVVVGSGFGGAVAALRLGQAGVRTTVLERGRRWDVDDAGTTFCTINRPDRRSAWFSPHPHIGIAPGLINIDRWAGIIDRRHGNGIDVVSGVGVGGGSLVFGAIMPQPRRQDFVEVFPSGIGYDEMDTVYWPRVRAMLGCTPMPADILAHDQYRGARAWLRYIEEFGKPYTMIDCCVDWDVIRDELAGRRVASHSVGEGPYGNNSGSKNSVDRNYLPQAVATGNVAVLPLHQVLEIHEVPGQAKFEVRCQQIDETGSVLARKTFVCDFLFMAAGSLHTSELLVTARAKGWLPALNGETGKGWGNNGDFLVLRANLRRNVGNRQGGPAVAVLNDDGNPFGKAVMGWEAAPLPAILGSTSMAHLVQAMTPARGSVDYRPGTGTAVLNWPYCVMETSADKAGRDLVTRLWWQTEGRHGYLFSGLPDYDRSVDMGSRATWHPLGGMAMGKACDLDGRAYGYPNLYVVDGALLPGSSANTNPALTIAAVAERCMDRFVAAHA